MKLLSIHDQVAGLEPVIVDNGNYHVIGELGR